MTLAGNICIRNGSELDYTWREAVESLLPVCDSITVCDGESTDGTTKAIIEWAAREPKIRYLKYPWPNPKGDVNFWVRWLNFCRMHIEADFEIQLDADEVLSETSYDYLTEFKKRGAWEPVSLWCKRWNFYKDAQHLIPYGVCLSDRVVRVAPQRVWLPSDGCNDERGNEAVAMAIESPIEVFHYGFLRRGPAFFKKARALQEYFFDSYDKRLADVEDKPDTWMTEIKDVEWINRLVEFKGKHPAIMKRWLEERGYRWEEI